MSPVRSTGVFGPKANAVVEEGHSERPLTIMVSSPAVTVPSHHVGYVPYVVTCKSLCIAGLVSLASILIRGERLRTMDSNVPSFHHLVHPKDLSLLAKRLSIQWDAQDPGSTGTCCRERPGRRDSRTGRCYRIRLPDRGIRSMAVSLRRRRFGSWTSNSLCSTRVALRWSSGGSA